LVICVLLSACGSERAKQHVVKTSDKVAYTHFVDCGQLGSCQLAMYMRAPAEGGPWPLILLVPGGPQPLMQQPSLLIRDLAPALVQRGAVVMTIEWRQGPAQGAGFPVEVEDVACAIGVARKIAANYGADPSRVTLVGHSLGGWAGAVLALTPQQYRPPAGECNETAGSLRPDRFVSIAGALDEASETDDISLSVQLGIDAAHSADADPFALIDRYPPGLPPIRLTLIHGTADDQVPVKVSREFRVTAVARGYVVDLVEVAGADHHAVLSAPLTATTIMAAASGSG
jgi:dienelactone hydrolase